MLFSNVPIYPRRLQPLSHPYSPRPSHLHILPHSASAQQSPSTDTPKTQPKPLSISHNSTTFWTDQWYPIKWAADIPAATLHPFNLFDRPYVLFLDVATGIYVVMDDVCPHRAVPLSEGRLLQRGGNTIVKCAYHGWQFSCSGKCTAIPAAGPDFVIPSTTEVKGLYATKIGPGGLIFFSPGDRLRADSIPLPLPPILQDGKDTIVFRDISCVLPLPFELLVENLIDPAHAAFVHHGTGEGKRKDAGAGLKLKLESLTEDSGSMVGALSNSDRPFIPSINLCNGGIMIYISVDTPTMRFALSFFAVPISRNVTNLISFRAARGMPYLFTKFRPYVPRWIDHCLGHVILDGDTAFLADSTRTLHSYGHTWREAYILANGTWDCLVGAWRGWFERNGHTMPFLMPSSPPPMLSKREINDRVRWHGQDCTSCRDALRRFSTGRMAAIVVAAVAITMSVVLIVIAAAMNASGPMQVSSQLVAFARRAVMLGLRALLVARGCHGGVVSLTYTDKAKQLLQPDAPSSRSSLEIDGAKQSHADG